MPSILKKTKEIKLIILGSISPMLLSCESEDHQRWDYINKEQCVADWGEDDCEEDRSRLNPYSSYYGRPGYYSYYTVKPKSAIRKSLNTNHVNISTVKRGGFGSTFKSFGG